MTHTPRTVRRLRHDHMSLACRQCDAGRCVPSSRQHRIGIARQRPPEWFGRRHSSHIM